jgi:hypothetical protein
MQGASLLYNLLLSGLRARSDWIDGYQSQFKHWQEELDLSAIHAWSLDEFWQVIDHPGHRITSGAKHFVSDWLELVRAPLGIDNNLKKAANLVQGREQRLKTSQSRFANRAVRDRWMGASGVDRLSFRWAQARTYLRDLANAR